ncbi:receptor-type tyrosine-protein phosphatase F-like [Montipora foliosa]|uniref:receptor-type tyrosine-protein phosphatase F-like n=1 Tax=Montipora foliosa TaxID=591990 RepID=UPI0035F1F3BD
MLVLFHSTLQLKCIERGDPEPNVTWTNNGTQVANTNTLVITNVAFKDAGQYGCVAKNRAGNVSGKIWIEVIVAPVVYVSPQNQTVVEGETTNISCKASGVPHPKLSWKFENRELPRDAVITNTSNQSVLQLPKTAKNMEGWYKCIAKNEAGEEYSNSSLHVLEFPTAEISPNPYPTMLEGDKLELTCKANEATWRITWEKNTVSKIQRAIITENGDSSILLIEKVEVSDSGEYSCKVLNKAGSASSSVYIKIRVPSNAPTGFMVTASTSTSVTASWQLPPADFRNGIITGFKLFYRQKRPDNQPRLLNISNASIRAETVRELMKFTEYEFQLLAYTSVGDGPNSSVQFVKTMEDAPSKPPSGFMVTASSSTSVTASWQLPPKNSRNGIIRGFKLFINRKGSGDKPDVQFIDVSNASLYTKTVTGLQGSMEYELQVLAYTSAGDGPQSSVQVVKTKRSAPSKPPSGFMVTASSSTSVTASWQLPAEDFRNGIITGFKLFYRQKRPDNQPRLLNISNASIRAETVRELMKFTEYEFQLLAYTSVGDGPNSSVQFVKTMEDAPSKPPSGFMVTASSSTSVTASWQLPPKNSRNGIIRGFKLFINRKGSGDKPDVQFIDVSNALLYTKTVTGLQGSMEYELQVLAYTSAGDGPQSSVQVVKTKRSAPSKPPSGFMVTASSSTSVTASWQLPAEDFRNGIITGFKLFYRQKRPDNQPRLLNISNASIRAETVRELMKFTEYEFQLLAYTSVGDGPNSSVQFVKTMEDAPSKPPSGFMVTASSSTSVTASWQLPPKNSRNGIIRGFKLFINRKGSGDKPDVQFIDVSNASLYTKTVTGLQGSMEYELQVLAYTSAGDGPQSSVQVVKTKRSGLQKATNPKVRTVLATRAIKWYYTVGPLSAVVLSALIILYLCKRRITATARSRGDAEEMEVLNFEVDAWEIARRQIALDEVIGSGAFGTVWRATLSRKNGKPGIRFVAAKCFSPTSGDEGKAALMREIGLGKVIGDSPQPNIVQFIGCVTTQIHPILIMEYLPCGDLLGYLRKSRGISDKHYHGKLEVAPLKTYDLMSFSNQIATGMVFLASRGIIHRDLAARNVLLDQNRVCKVTDFGLSYQNFKYGHGNAKKGCIPVKWTAPEILFGDPANLSSKSDVWSYGVVLYEIFTIGGIPYPGWSEAKTMAELKRGYRMPKPAHIANNL